MAGYKNQYIKIINGKVVIETPKQENKVGAFKLDDQKRIAPNFNTEETCLNCPHRFPSCTDVCEGIAKRKIDKWESGAKKREERACSSFRRQTMRAVKTKKIKSKCR